MDIKRAEAAIRHETADGDVESITIVRRRQWGWMRRGMRSKPGWTQVESQEQRLRIDVDEKRSMCTCSKQLLSSSRRGEVVSSKQWWEKQM